MHTNTLPEIERSELEAARQFLTSVRDEERRSRTPHVPLDAGVGVTLRNGIARARHRTRTPADV